MSQRASQGLAFLAEERPVESFEQLDSALRIVSVRSWMLLSVLFATLAGVGLFSSFYKAPLKVDGRGIILEQDHGDDGDSIRQVTAPAAGRLASVKVKIGAVVSRGMVLAEIDQSELRDRIKEARSILARLRDEDERLSRFDDHEAKSRLQALGELERTLRQNIALDSRRLDASRRIARGDRRLNRERMLNDSDTLKSQAESDAIESGINALEARLFELAFQRLQDATTRNKEKLKRALAIQAGESDLALLGEKLERDTRIVSPYAGKVVDLMLTPHALIEKGAPAVLLQPERHDDPLEAIVFVPAGLGKKVRVNDAVEVSPDTVRRHEHGFVRGRVLSISEIPATEMAMVAELKHKTLVSSFVGQYAGQVLLSIRVQLIDVRAPGTPVPLAGVAPANWLKWSSSSGASQRVSTGTLCSASIVVERRPLITLAAPWVKQAVGIY